MAAPSLILCLSDAKNNVETLFDSFCSNVLGQQKFAHSWILLERRYVDTAGTYSSMSHTHAGILESKAESGLRVLPMFFHTYCTP